MSEKMITTLRPSVQLGAPLPGLQNLCRLSEPRWFENRSLIDVLLVLSRRTAIILPSRLNEAYPIRLPQNPYGIKDIPTTVGI